MRSRRPFSSSVCWVSARPSSHGAPACFSDVSGTGPGAAVVTADQHDVGLGLADPGSDRADTDLGDELDVDPRRRVGVLQVVDQLLEILDRVDVVVRWRADQADARRGVAGRGDPRVHLVTRQLATLTGLGALGHLDLQVVGVDEVLAGDTEPTAGNLLDGTAPPRVVQPVAVLATFTGVALAADRVHRDRQRLVGLGARSSRSSSPRSRSA